MKIGIDCRTILNTKSGELAGVGHYTYYLVKNLLQLDRENEYVLFVDDKFQAYDDFKFRNCEIKKFPYSKLRRFLPLVYPHLIISNFLKSQKLDLCHFPANIIPLYYDKPSVVTVHDLAIYKYPELFPGGQSFSTKVLVPKSLAKANRIVAVSKHTKKDIIEKFAVPENKVQVIYEGVTSFDEVVDVDFKRVADKYGVGERYFLFVGTIEPRKNLVRLIHAFRNLLMTLNSPAAGWQLILAGGDGWHNEEIYQAISSANASILGRPCRRAGKERRCGIDNRPEELKYSQGERRSGTERRINQPVKHLGYISNDEKLVLMSQARAFVFPSIYEGFGLPVVEAMSMGAPLIISNSTSLSELADNNCGIMVDPISEAEISCAFEKMIVDEEFNSSCRQASKEKSTHFNWQKCAQETLEAYGSALNK